MRYEGNGNPLPPSYLIRRRVLRTINLFLVCKQVSGESSTYFYTANNFTIHLSAQTHKRGGRVHLDRAGHNQVDDLFRWVTRIGTRNASLIRHFVVNIDSVKLLYANMPWFFIAASPWEAASRTGWRGSAFVAAPFISPLPFATRRQFRAYRSNSTSSKIAVTL